MVIIFKKTLEKKGADDVKSKSTDSGPVRGYFQLLFSVMCNYLRIENAEGYVLIAVYLFIYYLRIENAEGYVLIAIYLFICMCVIRLTKKVVNRIAWNLVGWLVIIRGPFD